MTDTRNRIRKYYDTNAEAYAQQTRHTDMSASYEMLLRYVPEGGRILDVGCGSGRDLRYFHERGYAAEGLELSGSLAALAREYSGCIVHEADVCRWKPAEDGCFDALWACASLLHLNREEVFAFYGRLPEFLKPGGVIFCSMKEREESGYDDKGRYFCGFGREDVTALVDNVPGLQLLECTATADGLGRKDTNWITFVISVKERDTERRGS